jgi:signal transduction histidine kinase
MRARVSRMALGGPGEAERSVTPRGATAEHRDEIAALLRATRALVECISFDDAARVVLASCKELLDADAGFVTLRTASGTARAIAVLDPGKVSIDLAGNLPPPLLELLDSAALGRTVLANDMSHAPGATAVAPVPESVLLAPVVIAAEVAGLLGLTDKPGGFDETDAALAEVFADLTAVALVRSRTIGLLEQRMAALELEVRDSVAVAEALRDATVALNRSLDRETVLTTLLDRLRRMVPFDRASVMLLEEASKISVRAIFDGERVVPLEPERRWTLDPADHPIVHSILTTGTPLLVPDVHARVDWSLPTDRTYEACWMGIPLFARGEVAGLFSLSKREPGYFKEEHLRLAEVLSLQASVAVENAVLFEQMQASAMRMRALSRRLVEAQELERRHIARELHDEAGQALASLRFGLKRLVRDIEQGVGLTARVAELVKRTDAVIDGLHRLAADLRPASLEHLGLEAALRQYVRSVGPKVGLAVRFKARGFGGKRLPAAVETALYRVVQEAMTNVVRHAQATRVDVLAERRGDRVIVMIEDDGVGFDPDQLPDADHMGLIGLRERAEALGGSLTVESKDGAGTTIVVEVASADPSPDS